LRLRWPLLRDGTYYRLQRNPFIQLFLFQRAMMNGEAVQLAIQDRRPGIAFLGGTSVANILLCVFGKAVVIQRNCKFLAFRMADHIHALRRGVANFRQSRAELKRARVWWRDNSQDRDVHLDALRAIDEFSQSYSRAAIEPGKFDLGL